VSGYPVIADPALRGRRNMVTGANEDDWHLRGVDVERDIAVDRWLDVRRVEAGENAVQTTIVSGSQQPEQETLPLIQGQGLGGEWGRGLHPLMLRYLAPETGGPSS
jgi:hypothetical protein